MYDNYEFQSRENRKPKSKSARAECPSCFNNVNIGRQPGIGKIVVCPSCKTELEVVWLSPIELDFPYEEVDDLSETDDI